MDTLTVERTVWIAAPRERVWDAITNPARINQWWGGDDHWEIAALEVGGTVRFGFQDNQMFATIAVLDPPRQFTIQWPPQEQYHSIAMATTYLLEDDHGGTRVTVSETGFEALPDDIRQTRFDKTGEGYEKVLMGLKAHVEREPL